MTPTPKAWEAYDVLRGAGWYYTPISIDGQVVEKRVDAITVSREQPKPRVTVRYTLTNPYDHPVSIPIQSGLTLLYEYSQTGEAARGPELHVVPASVTRPGSGELLYAAEEPGSGFGTTAVQRQHLGTGIPNYRHPITESITAVPGDSLVLEAAAEIPTMVERMILVDAMVGPERPYGIYPQLLDHPTSRGRVPPPLRVYEGAVFTPDPPHVRIRRPPDPAARRLSRLPGWIGPGRYERLRRLFGHPGRVWCCAVGVAAVLLALSDVTRWVIAGATEAALVESARTVIFVLLTVGIARGNRLFRLGFSVALASSAAGGLVQTCVAIVRALAPATILLTEAALIPILYGIGASILLFSRSVRSHTDEAADPGHPEGDDAPRDS